MCLRFSGRATDYFTCPGFDTSTEQNNICMAYGQSGSGFVCVYVSCMFVNTHDAGEILLER